MSYRQRPGQQGLYHPDFEHDSCGVGFVADIKGRRSHKIVDQAKTVLINMTHRGAVGSDKNSGDGAGILTALPHEFLEKVMAEELGVSLPDRGRFSAGVVFLPTDPGLEKACMDKVEEIVTSEDQTVLGWRDVPRDNSMIGPTALAGEPVMKQLFVAAGRASPTTLLSGSSTSSGSRCRIRSGEARSIRNTSSTFVAFRPRSSSTRAC